MRIKLSLVTPLLAAAAALVAVAATRLPVRPAARSGMAAARERYASHVATCRSTTRHQSVSILMEAMPFMLGGGGFHGGSGGHR